MGWRRESDAEIGLCGHPEEGAGHKGEGGKREEEGGMGGKRYALDGQDHMRIFSKRRSGAGTCVFTVGITKQVLQPVGPVSKSDCLDPCLKPTCN